MAALLVVTGPPGAGKSVVAENLAGRFEPSVLVEGDAFFAFLRRGAVAPWLTDAHGQNTSVVRAAASAAGRFASDGYTTVYDGVIGPWFLDEFAAATELDHLDYVVLLPPVQRCVERVATRTGHGFSEEVATRHMHRDFATATVERRHVVDPPEGVDAVADLIVAAMAAGTLTYRASVKRTGYPGS